MQEFLITAKDDLQAARAEWLKALAGERRLSNLTVEAYERDTRQFLQFLTGHFGEPPDIADISALRPADLRAFLAQRRTAGAGARTLGRGLAGVRSLLRFLERKGQVNAAGATNCLTDDGSVFALSANEIAAGGFKSVVTTHLDAAEASTSALRGAVIVDAVQ